ncbi:MAG: hypothetical protein AB1568_15600 [Thermodesulfobacteriota bacterium]
MRVDGVTALEYAFNGSSYRAGFAPACGKCYGLERGLLELFFQGSLMDSKKLREIFDHLKAALGLPPSASDRDALAVLTDAPNEMLAELDAKHFTPHGFILSDFLPAGAGYRLTPDEVEDLRRETKASSANMARLLNETKPRPQND